jgi:hypothetical protein
MYLVCHCQVDDNFSICVDMGLIHISVLEVFVKICSVKIISLVTVICLVTSVF